MGGISYFEGGGGGKNTEGGSWRMMGGRLIFTVKGGCWKEEEFEKGSFFTAGSSTGKGSRGEEDGLWKDFHGQKG